MVMTSRFARILSNIYKSNRVLFLTYPYLNNWGTLEFLDVMQTREAVRGLRCCPKFSEPPSCLGEAM